MFHGFNKQQILTSLKEAAITVKESLTASKEYNALLAITKAIENSKVPYWTGEKTGRPSPLEILSSSIIVYDGSYKDAKDFGKKFLEDAIVCFPEIEDYYKDHPNIIKKLHALRVIVEQEIIKCNQRLR